MRARQLMARAGTWARTYSTVSYDAVGWYWRTRTPEPRLGTGASDAVGLAAKHFQAGGKE